MGQRVRGGIDLHSEGYEALTDVSIISIIIVEAHMYGILDVSGCGAKLESEEDTALLERAARDASLDVTGGAKRHGECIAEVILIRHGDPGAPL